jgi:hypothetical protein
MTDSVLARTGSKPVAPAGLGVSPHGPWSAAVVVVVPPLPSGLLLLPHAEAPRPMTTATPMIASLRMSETSVGKPAR